jgi:hypothetical protein
VADKRQIKLGIKRLQRVKTWQLVLLLILAGLLTATFLRLNNIGMVERRTSVLAADKQGDSDITRARLLDLQRYSAAHMNADSGTIYLEEQYARDTKRAIAAASQAGSHNNINVKADKTCKARFGGYSQAYVQCFASELAKHPAATNTPAKAVLPNVALYRQSFSSPLWSPDFAGLGVLVCGVFTLLIVVRLLGLVLLRILLRQHYRSL